MPEYMVNVYQQEDGSLPTDKWITIKKEDPIDAIQYAINWAIADGKKFILPFIVHVAKGKGRWPTGVPFCTQSYRVESV